MMQEKYQVAKILIDEHSEKIIKEHELKTCYEHIENKPLYYILMILVFDLLLIGGVITMRSYWGKNSDGSYTNEDKLKTLTVFLLSIPFCSVFLISIILNEKFYYALLKKDCELSEDRLKALTDLEFIVEEPIIEEELRIEDVEELGYGSAQQPANPLSNLY